MNPLKYADTPGHLRLLYPRPNIPHRYLRFGPYEDDPRAPHIISHACTRLAAEYVYMRCADINPMPIDIELFLRQYNVLYCVVGNGNSRFWDHYTDTSVNQLGKDIFDEFITFLDNYQPDCPKFSN